MTIPSVQQRSRQSQQRNRKNEETTPIVRADLPLYRFSVEEYHRLIQLGFFADQKRLELIEGILVQMSPMNPRQAFTIQRLSNFLAVSLADQAIVRTQLPITLPNSASEPEPDIAIAKTDKLAYQIDHPYPADLLLVVEVAYSSFGYDSQTKLDLYAREGIVEYWIVDIGGDQIEVHREPFLARNGTGMYRFKATYLRGQVIAPQAFPECQVDVDEILPQREEEPRL
jgi:Uma2 family endonuclease